MITQLVGRVRRKISQFHGYGGYSAWVVHAPHAERLLLTMQAGPFHHWDCYCPACKQDCETRCMAGMLMNSMFGKVAS